MWLLSSLACNLILLVNSSKCPEPKKPHRTSCTIFYNCVNLPDNGGYVWVPSKCTDGLVFQPYLRVCVVPGDIWTCDILSTDSTIVTKKYETPDTIDLADTSYLGYTQDPSDFFETIDSSYVIENDKSDSTTETATPYPLIEFEVPNDTTHDVDESVRNVSYHKEEKEYEYMNNQKPVPLPLMKKYKDLINDHYRLLNELMSRLYIYKEHSALISGATTVSPTHTFNLVATHNRKQNISLSYLVRSYIKENKLQDDKPNVRMEEGSNGSRTDNMIAGAPTASTLELLIDDLDSDNNIIEITGNLGERRYITIDRYKATAEQLTSRSVSVVECTRNVRLSNKTDCERYYTCDPQTATVVEYSCPLHTAFNVYSRICDTESAKPCGKSKNTAKGTTKLFVTRVIEQENTPPSVSALSKEKPCQALGKIKDVASDFHYYLCYSTPDSEEIKSIRMMCPNALIFCQSKRVCTTRRLCNAL